MKYERDPTDELASMLMFHYNAGLTRKINCEVSINPDSPCTICRDNGSHVEIRNHFHGSDFGACPRKVFWDMRATGSRGTTSSQSFLNDGHMHEALMLSTLRAGFGEKAEIEQPRNEEELVININGVKLIGHHDGIIKWFGGERKEKALDEDILNPYTAILECKAVKEYTFKKVKAGEISDTWYGQAQCYMIGKRISKTYFLVKNRVTSQLLMPIPIPIDLDWCKQSLDNLKKIIECLHSTGDITIPEKKHKTPRAFECMFCDHQNKCWGNTVFTEDANANNDD